MEHLDHMDMLRDGINLRAYGQRNPLAEYKIEALNMFEEMEGAIMDQIASLMYHVSIVTPEQQEAMQAEAQKRRAEQEIEKQKSQLSDHLKSAMAAHGEDVSAAESTKKRKNRH